MKYRDQAREMSRALRLNVPPIAVSFADKKPEGAEDVGERVAAGCAFWEMAGTRTIATSTVDHEMCAVGVYTHNLAEPSPGYEGELRTVLQVLGELQYASGEDVAQIPVLKSRPRHVIYGPLASAEIDADVVLIFAQAQQSLVITEAVQQVENGAPPAMGRPACGIIPQVVNSGRAALSLGCCGARAYLGVFTDDIVLWALPGNRLDEYVGRIVNLAKANVVLKKFHQLRMRDVSEGRRPSYEESLVRLNG